ncbi:hypothetical protein JWG39_11435 [Desulforhopalus vacuolatus]|uniref:hypothetical protein n=1 Tax=Desulforhopalus vacuolatus TaxID=40414 RepID=UPI001964767A|nr:hypothetical protein [Desulforhopalus vacuolatus]MBM9520425.1 hypothetical protein [Desulforhopalus vacuolatus]
MAVAKKSPSRSRSTGKSKKTAQGKKRSGKAGKKGVVTGWIKAHLGVLLLSVSLLFLLGITLFSLGYVVFLQG